MILKKNFLLALVLLIGIEFFHSSSLSAGDLDESWWIFSSTDYYDTQEMAFYDDSMYIRRYFNWEWTKVSMPYVSHTDSQGRTRYITFYTSQGVSVLIWGTANIAKDMATYNAVGFHNYFLPTININNPLKPPYRTITASEWSPPRHLTVLEGVDFYEGAMATNGTYIWRAGKDTILKEDMLGNLLDYITVPADSAGELTFDGVNLWYAANNHSNALIYKIDMQGNLLDTIPGPEGQIFGLTYDGVNLWCAAVDQNKKTNEGRNVIYQIDTEGNILKSFDLWFDDVSGLAFDGTALWCSVEFDWTIYRLDTDGKVIGLFYSPYDYEYMGNNDYFAYPMSLAISGTTLWVVGSGWLSTDRYKCDISDIIGNGTATTTIETTSTTTTIPDGTGRLDTIESIFENMVTIPAGAFDMGGGICSDCLFDDQFPVHTVTLTASYKMTAYEITQGQWQAVMSANPSYYNNCGNDCPVEQVSWKDIELFIRRLKELTGLSYRLPTEAEWEYAARAGTKTLYPCGDNETCLKSIAWYADTAGGITHPAGQKQANAWGLYDMSGNVREWVHDWYNDEYYEKSPGTDPQGPDYSSNYNQRVMRGGGIFSAAIECQSADRDYNYETFRGSDDVGFRLCLSSDNRTFLEPPFIDNNNGTVTDKRTGLVWLKTANPCNKATWDEAEEYCAKLSDGQVGLSDGSTAGQWRLPSKEELQGLGTDPPVQWNPSYGRYPSVTWTIPSEPFTNVQSYNYWTNETYSFDFAYSVGMGSGFTGSMLRNYKYYVWPVRDAK